MSPPTNLGAVKFCYELKVKSLLRAISNVYNKEKNINFANKFHQNNHVHFRLENVPKFPRFAREGISFSHITCLGAHLAGRGGRYLPPTTIWSYETGGGGVEACSPPPKDFENADIRGTRRFIFLIFGQRGAKILSNVGNFMPEYEFLYVFTATRVNVFARLLRSLASTNLKS